jgi:hypothetical protein
VLKEVAFNVRIGVVEINGIVTPSIEHIVQHLEDWAGPPAAGEIDNVTVAGGAPK